MLYPMKTAHVVELGIKVETYLQAPLLLREQTFAASVTQREGWVYSSCAGVLVWIPPQGFTPPHTRV